MVKKSECLKVGNKYYKYEDVQYVLDMRIKGFSEDEVTDDTETA